jgi:hypothetical protein
MCASAWHHLHHTPRAAAVHIGAIAAIMILRWRAG